MNKSLPLILLIAGCSFIPPHERPAAPVPQAWPLPSAVSPAPGFNGDWRAFFTDPALQRLIGLALEHNRDLMIAIARVEEARAQAGLARADRFPTVDVGLQEQAARVPGSLTSSGRPTHNRRFDANLSMTAFELDFWGRVKSLDEAARANFLASDYARQAFELSLISDVASAYYSLIELATRSRLTAATLKNRAENRRLIERRRDVGLATDLDFLAADGAYQAAAAELANLERQQAAAANALRLLVGSDIGAFLDGPALGFGALPEVPVGLPSEVLLRRPDVLAAEQKLIAANANIGAARAAFFPKIVLTVLAGSASPALSGLFGGGSGAWSFVPVLKWPLFDAGRNAANEDIAAARQHIAVAEYEKTIQQAFREVADLLAAREHYAQQLEALVQAEAAQAERLRRVEARQRAGVSSYLELLDAQRELFAAQQAVISVRRALAATAAGLFKATGGA
ncbi:efflux transporter outer membrane subunit [Sulfuricystis multivorans]|uniref:efflux transporter outer membrane subunit n=1 Tax=Sulfuricystis multivorans TaxID=2211108 RepID=UPI000F84B5D2|nr:efflux transporter outer membrane subunit [Sulfuricystis multivorans]